jgi:hypothetical protein
VVNMHNELLVNDKRWWNSVICDNMDEPRECYVKWNYPGTERQIAHDLTLMWDLKKLI